MKSLITLLAITFSLFVGQFATAQGLGVKLPEVVQVLHDSSQEIDLEIKESTFIPNILGYACPLPALNLEKWQVWGTRLRHNLNNGFMVTGIGLPIHDPNHRFCTGWPSAEEVFGPEFQVGNTIKVQVRIVRELVEWVDHNDVVQMGLRETVSTMLNLTPLSTSATVWIGEAQN
ncbi:MAG: hypothetical protein HRT45_01940 [Bdellovibrionales bacterium]|nr:hypothetical protein [Bdellovibrionales bacterium]